MFIEIWCNIKNNPQNELFDQKSHNNSQVEEISKVRTHLPLILQDALFKNNYRVKSTAQTQQTENMLFKLLFK